MTPPLYAAGPAPPRITRVRVVTVRYPVRDLRPRSVPRCIPRYPARDVLPATVRAGPANRPGVGRAQPGRRPRRVGLAPAATAGTLRASAARTSRPTRSTSRTGAQRTPAYRRDR